MTEESIREIIQAIFLLPEIKNGDVKLDENDKDITLSNGIDLSPVIKIKIEHDIDQSSKSLERKDTSNFSPNSNAKWGQYHRYKSTSNISRRQSLQLDNGNNENNGNISSIQQLCKSVNKIWFGQQELPDNQVTDIKGCNINKQIKSSSDSQLSTHRYYNNTNGLYQDNNTINKSKKIQDVNNNQWIANHTIVDDSYFMNLARTSSHRKHRHEITWDQSRARDKLFKNQLLAQAFECDSLFEMLKEIQRKNHFLNQSMARVTRDKAMFVNKLFADGIQFDTEDEVWTAILTVS